MSHQLSVIIPVYNLSEKTRSLSLDAIARVRKHAQMPTEVITIDNGSKFPIHVGDAETNWTVNRGIAPAFNEGIRLAKGDFLCFLNSDCMVEPDWDRYLCVAAEAKSAIAMPFTNGEKSDGIGITGWCFVVQREVAAKIGPFDETFVPAQYEDTDWFHRALQKGIPLVNVPQANVKHVRKQGGSLEAPWADRAEWLHMANRYRYAWKHGVDPKNPPPFWTRPLVDINIEEAPDAGDSV